MSQAHQQPQSTKKKGASKPSKSATSSLAAQAKLTEFITTNDFQSVTDILQPGFKFDLNVSGPDGNTPLGLACQLGHSKMITALVIAKADMNQVDSEGVSPLGHACKSGHTDAVEALLALKADPNFHTASTSSPISMAATGNHLEVVIRLVDAKADVNPSGDKPLYLACKGNYLSLVKYLFTNGATIPPHVSTKNFSSQVKELLGLAASVRMSDSSSQKYAHSDTEVDEKRAASKLLMESIESGNTAQVKTILKRVRLVPNYGPPLGLACKEGHLEIIEALVAAKIQVSTTNEKNETPLFSALEAKRNASQAVTFLLSQKADVNHQRYDGASPLCSAAYLGNVEIIALLLAAKADHDITMTKAKGASPVWLAAQGDHADAIRVLAEANADLNKVNHEGFSPLAKASKSGHKNSVDALLTLNADPNGDASLTAPPICMATSGGHIEVVKSLVVAKANLNIDSPLNPLYLAHKSNNQLLVQYLKENGADVAMFDRILRGEAPGKTSTQDKASKKSSSASQQDIPHSSSRSILLAQPPVSLALESSGPAASPSEESASPIAEEDSTPAPAAKTGCVPA